MFGASAGVYDRIVDKSFVVNAGGLLAGGVVISSKKGSTDVVTVTSAKEFIDLYGIPSSDNPSMYAALRFLNRAGILSVKRVINDAVAATGTLTWTDGIDTEDHLIVDAANPGAWGNDIVVKLEENADLPAGVFNVIVEVGGEVVEEYEVSRDPNAKNGFGNNIFIENVINSRSLYIRVTDNPAVTDPYDFATDITLSGGADDTVAPTSGAIVTAWDDFLNTNSVPANLLINAGWASAEVQTKMLAVAEARKDAVAILDIPEDTAQDVAAMITYRKDTLAANTEFGGLYGGWIRIYDQYNDKEVTIPPSGDVAAVFEYTVEVANRWDAPAGLQRGVIPNALGVSKVLTEGERDQLYVAGINPVTTYGGASALYGVKKLYRYKQVLLTVSTS
jgi:Phage tail sheath protein FI